MPYTRLDQIPLIMTVTEVADLLKMDRRTVANMCGDGRLPAVKVGGEGRAGDWRIQRADVLSLVGMQEKTDSVVLSA